MNTPTATTPAEDGVEITALAIARARILTPIQLDRWIRQHSEWRRLDPAPALQKVNLLYDEPAQEQNWFTRGGISDDERLEIAFMRMQARGLSTRFGYACCRICFPLESHRQDVQDALSWATCRFHAYDALTLDRGYLDLEVIPPMWRGPEYDPDDPDWARAYDVVTEELTSVGLGWHRDELGLPVRVALRWNRQG